MNFREKLGKRKLFPISRRADLGGDYRPIIWKENTILLFFVLSFDIFAIVTLIEIVNSDIRRIRRLRRTCATNTPEKRDVRFGNKASVRNCLGVVPEEIQRNEIRRKSGRKSWRLSALSETLLIGDSPN